MKKIGTLLMMVLLLMACQNKQNSEELLKIRIGVIRVPNDKTLAREKSYFEEYFDNKGIETEFIFFDSGVAANQAFMSGSIDFAEMGHTNGVVAQSKEIPVKLIWIHEVLGNNEALVVQKDSGIETYQDLKGKKIATTFSSTSHYSLLKVLEREGLTPEKDLTVLDMQTADIVAAWERGDIDAAYTWEPGLSKILETGEVLVDSETLSQEGIVTANIDLVHKDFAEKYPDLVRDYITVLAKAGMDYKQDPNEAARLAGTHLDISEEDALKQMQGTIWLSREELISPQYFGTNNNPGDFIRVFIETGEYLKEQGFIKNVPNEKEVNDFIDSSFIEASLKEYKDD